MLAIDVSHSLLAFSDTTITAVVMINVNMVVSCFGSVRVPGSECRVQ